MAYSLAVFDTVEAAAGMDEDVPELCVPLTVSRQQFGDVVCQRLLDHPAERHLSAAAIVWVAASAAWPCQ